MLTIYLELGPERYWMSKINPAKGPYIRVFKNGGAQLEAPALGKGLGLKQMVQLAFQGPQTK